MFELNHVVTLLALLFVFELFLFELVLFFVALKFRRLRVPLLVPAMYVLSLHFYSKRSSMDMTILFTFPFFSVFLLRMPRTPA